MKKWMASFWVLLFILTVAGAAYIGVRFSESLTSMPRFWYSLTSIQWAVLLAATALFYYLDYLRLNFLLHIIGARIPILRGIEAITVSEFAAILTPTAELHVPAAVFFLTRRNHIPSEKATAAVSTKTAYGIIWVCVISLTLLFVCDDVALPNAVRKNLGYIVIPAGAVTLYYLTAIAFGDSIRDWSRRKEKENIRPTAKMVYTWIGRMFCQASTIGRSTSSAHLCAHVANVAYILTYCFIGGWLCHCFNLPLSPLKTITVFSTSLMVDYLAPVPGSIGVTEFVTAYMIHPKLTQESIFVAIALRIFCKYLVLIPGFLITLNLIRKEGISVFHQPRHAGF